MTIKLVTSREIDISYKEMLELGQAGALNLGINDDVASRILGSEMRPRNSSASSAKGFWNFISIAVFAGSVYWSFIGHWWWWIIGLAAMVTIWKANKKSNSQNVIEAAMADPAFYERVRGVGGWKYQIDEDRVAQFRKS